MSTETTPTTAGREFARKFKNKLCELHLQQGIHKRIELILDQFAEEHPNLRAQYTSREVDESYFQSGLLPAEAFDKPKLQGIAVDGDRAYEFVAFRHGVRVDVSELRSLVHIEETWLEPKPEEPFQYRVVLYHSFQAATVLKASTGEAQDAAQDFIGRVRYLRGW